MGLTKCLRILKVNTGNKISTLVSNKTDSRCLLFENNQLMELSNVEFANRKREFGYLPELDAYGLIGVLNTFIEDGSNAAEIKTVSYLIAVKECQRVALIKSAEVFLVTSVQVVPLTEDATPEIAHSIKRILSLKVFYFAWSADVSAKWDLTKPASRQSRPFAPDSTFVWNEYLMTSFSQFGIRASDWLVSLVCGFVEDKIVYSGSAQVRCCLLTRLSSSRAGARLSTRGIDTEGRVAVFAETEQIVWVEEEGYLASFLQIRGSVPLFWEQRNYQAEQHKISLTRRFHCTTPALLRHFSNLQLRYGKILILDLLGIREAEHQLSSEFKEHLRESSELKGVKYVNFDFLELCKGGKRDKLDVLWNNQLIDHVQASSCHLERCEGNVVISGQAGVVRTNCFDCLDRTNAVQTYIGLKMAQAQTEQILSEIRQSEGEKSDFSEEEKKRFVEERVSQVEARLDEAFSSLWHHNGNNLARLFTGTTALHSSHTKSKLSDTGASVARAFKATQLEGVMQGAIDLLLGQHTFGIKSILSGVTLLGKNTIREPVSFLQLLSSRAEEVLERDSQFVVAVATYNVNGGRHTRSYLDKENSLSEWLNIQDQPVPDVFAIGFEELVEITTKNIISTSSSHRKSWEQELTNVLSARHPYFLLTSEQLVGTCLCVFIRQELAESVRDTAVSVIKTGMSGKAGNKGSIAVFLQLMGGRYAFVCSHFAAHQDKVVERNADFVEACKKIEFSSRFGPLSLTDMDYVFWCGDLNYRLDMGREQVHSHIQNKAYSELLKADQLRTQIYDGYVFHGFLEGEIGFAPTFKYDVFTDRYDTSDKQRIPAWTDRVLWRSNHNYSLQDKVSRYKFLEAKKKARGAFVLGDVESVVDTNWSEGMCLYYGRSELKASDHRPVVAYIRCDSIKVDEERLLACLEKIKEQLGPLDFSVKLEIDPIKSPNSQLLLGTIIDSISGLGSINSIKILDEHSLQVRFAEYRNACSMLALNGCQIDGKFMRITAVDTWSVLMDTIGQNFSSNDVLSPEVKLQSTWAEENALPLVGAPLLNLPLRKAAVPLNRSPLPSRHRTADASPLFDVVMEPLEFSEAGKLEEPLVPTSVRDKPLKLSPPMRPPLRPNRPMSMCLSAQSKSEFLSLASDRKTSDLFQSISSARPPRPARYSPEVSSATSHPPIPPTPRSYTVSSGRKRSDTSDLYSVPRKVRTQSQLSSLNSIELTLDAAMRRASRHFSDDSVSEDYSDVSDEDALSVPPTADNTADQTANQITDQTTDQTADQTANNTADQTADPTADQTAGPTADPTADQTAGPTADPTADNTAGQTPDPTADPTTDNKPDQTADPTADQTADPTADPTADQTADQTADPTADPTADHTNTPILTAYPVNSNHNSNSLPPEDIYATVSKPPRPERNWTLKSKKVTSETHPPLHTSDKPLPLTTQPAGCDNPSIVPVVAPRSQQPIVSRPATPPMPPPPHRPPIPRHPH